MIAYLESDAAAKPTTVTSADVSEDSEPVGRLTSTITRGELFLHPQGDKQTQVRLRWGSDDTERARPLPVGTWMVTGYRQVAVGEDGTEWIWSTASPGFREIEVKAGETTHLEVRQWIAVNARACEKKGKQRVSLVFQAEEKLGNTLYRHGKRIGIRWQCLDDEGTVLDEGPMRYG